ncbi:copper resistance CopC family protein [Arthrobacter sp. UNC362MFTsu5.1]|uniref:copper resistance CopC family protein n=1 Tax=Arthrobacter sp. UNC362MFTsu5.1 TaxID=1449044 RepID=UPI000487B36A|nr:copper resistance CopC family protein [Arthrobacter sp. UNC362MFTsu5.1]
MKTALRHATTRLVLAAATALLLPVLATAPAVAHDSLASTEPARDAVLDTAPATVSLTLSNAPLNSAQLNTSILKVTDSTGKTLSDDNVQVNGDTLSTAITEGQPGPYTVQWRAVSSDGHPIEGTYTFTVQSAAATATPSQAAAAASQSATAPAVTSGTTPVTPAPRPDDSNALLVAGIGAAVIALIAGLIALSRRKENRPQS